MNQPRSMYSKPIQFLYRLNYRAFIRENIEKNDRVLEIGSGLGFMKPLVIAEGAFYKGIEPIESVHKISKKLYGKECFFNEQLEKNCNDDISFNKILSMTVLDEINDKASFVEKIKSYCNNETKILLAVRNADFPFRRGTKVTSSFNNVITNDLSYGEWIKLFNSLNLRFYQSTRSTGLVDILNIRWRGKEYSNKIFRFVSKPKKKLYALLYS